MGKYIWNLYVNRFYGKRNLVLFVILWIAFDSFYAEIDYACKVLDYPCSFWYFLNVMTNHFMCGAIGLSAVYLFSNAPYLNRNGMYQMIRQGKYKWLLSQLGSIILSGFSFTAVLFFTGWIRMLPHMDWTWFLGKNDENAGCYKCCFSVECNFCTETLFYAKYGSMAGRAFGIYVGQFCIYFDWFSAACHRVAVQPHDSAYFYRDIGNRSFCNKFMEFITTSYDKFIFSCFMAADRIVLHRKYDICGNAACVVDLGNAGSLSCTCSRFSIVSSKKKSFSMEWEEE